MLETTALLYKLAPEELPDYGGLRSRKVIDYVPEWKRQEEKASAAKKAAAPPVSEQQLGERRQPFPINPAENLGYRVEAPVPSDSAGLGMVELTIDSVCGEDDINPPGR